MIPKLPTPIGIFGSTPQGLFDNAGEIAAAKLMSLAGFVGMIGDVPFHAHPLSVKTFESVKRKTEAKFVDHAIINQKQATEFTGMELDEIEFTAVFNGSLGIEPLTECIRLRQIISTGEPQRIIMAGANLGNYTLRPMEEEWIHTRNGRPTIVKLELIAKEYVESIQTQSQMKRREDELRRSETGKGGPERLPGSGKPTQTRKLEPMIDPITRMPIGGG